MAIAYDASTQASTSLGTSPFTFNHTPVGTPKGVFVFLSSANNRLDEVTSITYGGVAMGAYRAGTWDTTGEIRTAQVWFLGSGIPTGTQTVSIAHDGTATSKWFTCLTVTATGDTHLAGTGTGTAADDQANPSVTITGISGASYGAALLFSGLPDTTSITAGSGMTMRQQVDFGANTGHLESSTSENASGNLVMGFTATTDDVAMVAIAIEEDLPRSPSTSDAITVSESAQIAQADTINAAPRFIPELIIH